MALSKGLSYQPCLGTGEGLGTLCSDVVNGWDACGAGAPRSLQVIDIGFLLPVISMWGRCDSESQVASLRDHTQVGTPRRS